MFCYFFGIFYSESGWNPSERLFLFSLFLSLSHPILAWKEAMMVISNFLNFFAIFFEFSIPGRVETLRNDYFYFLSISAFPILFWLEKKLWRCFLIFWIFLLFFWNFLLRDGHEHIGTIFFIFSRSPPFQTYFTWKEAAMVFSKFLNVFAIFLEFSITGQVGTHRNDSFYVFSFSAIPNLFWLGKKLWLCFLIFWIFLLFFWNFLFRVR